MECLHRFCRECIDKSMRLGNNEFPACRKHCASRRSLRDDPKYDALISALYPNIDKSEDEELGFDEEEKIRCRQIQDSIAQTQRRQSEALGKKRSSARATAAAFASRSQVYRTSRGSRNQRATEQLGSDEENYVNGCDRGSADARDDNDAEFNRHSLGASAGLVGNSEMLAWGRGGMRSNTRHSNQSAGNVKIARSTRLSKMLERFQDRVQEDALNIHLTLVPLDEQRSPSLQLPHLRCEPTITTRHLCQYVALNTAAAEVDEIEISLVQQSNKDVLSILEGHETLAELQAVYSLTKHDMHFAYRQKLPASMNSI